MTTSSSGLIGSVTHAWRMWVVIGIGTPAMSEISVLQPGGAVEHLAGVDRAAVGLARSVTLPFERSMPEHLGVRVDLGAALVGAARQPPDDRVVADDRRRAGGTARP